MRKSLIVLAFTATAFAAGLETPRTEVAQPDEQAQAPAPAAPDAAKPADPPPPPPKFGGWAFNLMGDVYTTHNGNGPTQDVNQLQNFNLHQGAPRFSLGKLTIDKSDSLVGLHIDVGVGETMRLIHAADPAAQQHKGLRYFEQMYMIFKPKNTKGTEIDFGQFVTSAGAEVIESTSNWNYSRSLLFAWAIPYYHFGLKTSTPVTKETTVSFQVVNAWNNIWGNHTFQNVGFAVATVKDKKYGYALDYYGGKSDLGNSVGMRHLLDGTFTYCPNCNLQVYVNGSWGRNNRFGGGYDQWYGIASAARYQMGKIFAAAGRVEFFNDPSGFATGQKQMLKEATLTGEAKLNDHFVTRLEYRHDSSDHTFFDHGKSPAVKGMDTLTLGIVTLWGWK